MGAIQVRRYTHLSLSQWNRALMLFLHDLECSILKRDRVESVHHPDMYTLRRKLSLLNYIGMESHYKFDLRLKFNEKFKVEHLELLEI